MPSHRDSFSSSVVPPTLSPTHSCSTSQMSPQSESEKTRCPLPPLASDQFVDDVSDIDSGVSDIDGSDSDDDLSSILDVMAVTTIPIPQNPVDVTNLRTQAKAKCKIAIQKCKLANADFREAVLKAKLYRCRAQHAKHVLDATKVYAHHVDWTIQRSKYRDGWPKVTTVTDSGQHGTKVNHFVATPGGSMAITLD